MYVIRQIRSLRKITSRRENAALPLRITRVSRLTTFDQSRKDALSCKNVTQHAKASRYLVAIRDNPVNGDPEKSYSSRLIVSIRASIAAYIRRKSVVIMLSPGFITRYIILLANFSLVVVRGQMLVKSS